MNNRHTVERIHEDFGVEIVVRINVGARNRPAVDLGVRRPAVASFTALVNAQAKNWSRMTTEGVYRLHVQTSRPKEIKNEHLQSWTS